MDRRTLLISRRDEIFALAERREAKDIRTFWSVARSEPRADSDVDPLIDLVPGRSLLDPGGLAMDLSLLSHSVDAVTGAGPLKGLP